MQLSIGDRVLYTGKDTKKLINKTGVIRWIGSSSAEIMLDDDGTGFTVAISNIANLNDSEDASEEL